jgi:hypothetical protein
MPQARITHQPREASYKTKQPETTNAVQAQVVYGLMNNPAIIKAAPSTARRIRPVRFRFGAKNCRMQITSTEPAMRKKHRG